MIKTFYSITVTNSTSSLTSLAHSHVARGPRCWTCQPHLTLSLHASPARHAYSSKNSPSSNLAAAQWEFPIVKNPIGYIEAPHIRPKLPFPVDRSQNPSIYLPHPWNRRTYHAKRHPDPICHFSTMHWTDRPTDTQSGFSWPTLYIWLPGKPDYKPISRFCCRNINAAYYYHMLRFNCRPYG